MTIPANSPKTARPGGRSHVGLPLVTGTEVLRQTAVWLAACAVVTFSIGCTTLRRRGPIDQDVVRARQQTQQALNHIHRARWDQAEDSLLKAIDANPQDANARRVLADVLWSRGARDVAVEQLRKARECCDDDNLELVIRLGQMEAERGNDAEAGRLADEAIWRDKHQAPAWKLRGRVMRQRGYVDEALGCYLRALSENSEDLETRLNLAEIYLEQNRPERTLATLVPAAPAWDDTQLPQHCHWLRGIAYEKLDRPQDAADAFIAALEAGPASAELYVRLARAELAGGRLWQARQSAELALRSLPPQEAGHVYELLALIDSQPSPAPKELR